MNILNAIKLRDQLLSLPGKFDYGNFALCRIQNEEGSYSTSRNLTDIKTHPCGTSACVAGWCAIMNNPDITTMTFTVCMDDWSAQYLELTRDEQQFLFYPCTVNSYEVGYEGKEYDTISEYNLQDAIDRLNWLISKHSD